MATQRQCGCSSASAFPQLAKAFSLSSSLPLMPSMQVASLLLFAFLSLLSPAHSHTTESSPLASSQIYTQEEPSITKPFIYETVPASSSAISNPAFIYESVAASFSPRPRADRSHLHDDSLPQVADAALLDDGSKHNLPSIAKPSFIYESVAASLPQKPNGSNLLRESAPQEEHAFLLDDGIGKPITKKEVAPKPSFIYESVIAASIPSRPPGDDSILHNNVPQEENAIDDGTINSIMQKKEEPVIAKPSFIYEAVAASIHPEVRDGAIRTNVPQEENGFLIDDGGKHEDSVEKDAMPTITGKAFIYELVATQSHIAAHAAGDSQLHDNVSQEENSSHLDDDGKHVHKGLKKEEPIKAKLSLGNDPVAASSHPGSPGGSVLRDNVPQPDIVLLLDNGGKHVHESPAADEASTQDGGKFLQDNVPQEAYNFLRDDGRKKPISSAHHDGNNKVLLIDTKAKEVKSQSLHDIDVKKSLNVKENEPPTKAPASLLHDNAPLGKHAFLVDDGDIKHVEHDSHVASLKEVDGLLHATVAQEKHGSLVDDGGKHADRKSLDQSVKEEEHVLHDNIASQGEYSSLLDDGGSKELHSNKLLKDKDDNIKNHKKLPIYHKLRLGKRSFNEENLRMVVDDSSKNMQIKKGPQPVTGAVDGNCNEGNLRMVEEDSSNKMIHEQNPMTETRIGDLEKGNLRMVVEKRSRASDIIKGNSNEENLRSVVGGDTSSKIVHGVEGNAPMEESLRIHKGSEVEGYPAKKEKLTMVVGDSSNSMIQTGYQVQGNPNSDSENVRMVVDDSSNSMVQEGYGSPPKSQDNLRMVVDDTSNNMLKKGPFGTRGRSRTCTSNPDVCSQLAHAEQMNHIALYGQPLIRLTQEKKPACCSGVCVDLNNNHLTCGSCGKACGLSQTCCNGKCTDLNKDDLNCGQCGHSCPSFSPCQYGMCGYY